MDLADGVRVQLLRADESYAETLVSFTVLRSESWNNTQLTCSLNSTLELVTNFTVKVTNVFSKFSTIYDVNIT